ATLEERARLAREIHDTLAQGLTGIVVQLGAAQRALEAESEAADQHIDLAQQMAREALAEARRSVWNLRAPALERGDLSDALRGLVGRRSRPETEASFEQRGEPWLLPPGVESALLRVCQEALANVAKHAGATHATVALEYTPDAVHLSINDDGAGFADLAFRRAWPRQAPGAGLRCWACASGWRRWAAAWSYPTTAARMSWRWCPEKTKRQGDKETRSYCARYSLSPYLLVYREGRWQDDTSPRRRRPPGRAAWPDCDL